MKRLVLGDIHGRSVWKEIIELEQPDQVIFLGDYVASFNIPAEDQIVNLEEILEYKKNNPSTILLRGNHDTQHLGYYWAQCSGFNHTVHAWMREHENEFLAHTQWIYTTSIGDRKVVFSHAGISKVWLEDSEVDFENINSILPCEKFGFIPRGWDMYGTSDTQPCTWIRPETLVDVAIDGYDQVVGHTHVKKVTDLYDVLPLLLKSRDIHIWLCDALEQENVSYLVINDDKYEVKELKHNSDENNM